MKSTLKGMAEKSLQAAPAHKRAQFAKDLDKLISGDYVLVPKQPTAEMERAGMKAGGGFLTITIFKTMVAAAQGVSQ